MTTAKEFLEQAKAVIATKKTWTKDTAARNSSGDKVQTLDADACEFCAMGALIKVDNKVADNRVFGDAFRALYDEANKLGYVNVADMNDNGGHAVTLAAFDLAIKECDK